MTHRLQSYIVAILLFSVNAGAQFIGTPPVQNGFITGSEYGNHADGANRSISGASNWYCTWDANNIYFAILGSNISEGALIYIDVDPFVPVNGGGNVRGSVAWSGDYDRTRVFHPIRSDFSLYIKDTYNEYRYADGAGDWTGAVANTITSASAGNIIEWVIPWNTVTGGSGRPSSFNWFGYKLYNNGNFSNGSYDPVPTGNETPLNAGPGLNNLAYPVYYHTVINTDNGTATSPFSVRSLCYHEDDSASGTGGYIMAAQTVYDLTINDNSLDNGDNANFLHGYDNVEISNRILVDGDITINHDLYVAQGSALLPNDNEFGTVDVRVTMDGSAGTLSNLGRIDCNPEVFGLDYLDRRLAFVIDGNITYAPSGLFKELARFSDITINPGKSLNAPPIGSAELELQFGSLVNAGVLDCTGAAGGSLSIGLRGDLMSTNEYGLANPFGTGSFQFDDFLIGRNLARLQPIVNGGTVRMSVAGNFENYGDFQATTTNGRIDVVMNGSVRQEIRGNTTETLNARTTFGILEIENDNGLSNSNSGADVHFVSFGGGSIDYYVQDGLTMTTGDLVTRDRADSSLEHRLLVEPAAVMVFDELASDNTGAPSSFVDGPLFRHPGTASNIDLEYPVGKNGDARPLTQRYSNIPFSAVDTFKVEVFNLNSYALANTLPAVPEPIINSSTVHWWRIGAENGVLPAGHQMEVTATYDVFSNDDGVTDPPNLRLLSAPAGGGALWSNVTPFRGAVVTGPGRGNITSDAQALTSAVGDYTFGNLGSNPLPVELLEFDGRLIEGEVALEWSTASETNSARFKLFHSLDMRSWEEIGVVLAQGFSSQLVNYRFVHSNPVPGWNYYRLFQEDFDGAMNEKGIVHLFLEESPLNGLSIYPNPASDVLFISSTRSDAHCNYEIIDARGRIARKGRAWMYGQIQLELDMEPGLYTFRLIRPDGFTEEQRFIVH